MTATMTTTTFDAVVADLDTPSSTPPARTPTTAERYGLTAEQLDAFGAELDAIRERIVAERGAEDVAYMRRIIKVQRGLAFGGRASLFFVWVPGVGPLLWAAGAGALGVAKILDNMEIGHNVMHGQFDWTRDPALSSTTFDWDTACPGDQWRHSHNYLHHTFTNVLGKDRDIGYGVLRMSETHRWSPWDLLNPVKATALMLGFDLGVMLHDVEVENVIKGKRTPAEAWATLKGGLRKTGTVGLKDFVLWPLLTGPLFLSTLAANLVANLIRNVWSFSIIFCGHFPEGTHEFTLEETEGESKGGWYFRQLLGSANIRGSRLFHILSGNLSHQIEHHLFPDLPANRYQEIAPEVEAIATKYGLPYNSHRFSRQLGTTWQKIWRLALPT